jgi:hypothetical protein
MTQTEETRWIRPDIAAIEARLGQVTPGPWRRHGCDVWSDADPDQPLMVTPRSRDSSSAAREQADRDAEFIAHAVEDVKALLGEIRALGGGTKTE